MTFYNLFQLFIYISFPSFDLLCTNLLWFAKPLYQVYFLSHLSQWHFLENIFFSFWLFLFWWSPSHFVFISKNFTISFSDTSISKVILGTTFTSCRAVNCNIFSALSILIGLKWLNYEENIIPKKINTLLIQVN